MAKDIFRPLWTQEEYMLSLGYKLIKDDGIYAKYSNIGGLVCLSYGVMPENKRFIYFNGEYDAKQGVFCGIREDGDTRSVFNGVIDSEITFKLILNAVR